MVCCASAGPCSAPASPGSTFWEAATDRKFATLLPEKNMGRCAAAMSRLKVLSPQVTARVVAFALKLGLSCPGQARLPSPSNDEPRILL